MYAPVMRAHRVSVEQMAILEPVLSETVTGTCLTIIREALDEAVKLGVPEQAARDFVMGHLGVEIAIVFQELPNGTFSDGAKRAIEKAKSQLFRPGLEKGLRDGSDPPIYSRYHTDRRDIEPCARTRFSKRRAGVSSSWIRSPR